MMTWDIRPGQEETYFAFITQDFPNVLRNAGLQLTDAWYTVYGNWPQVSMGFISEDLQALESFLASDMWQELKHRLLAYIQSYQQKIVMARGGFQL
jgi:hypothetical protein